MDAYGLRSSDLTVDYLALCNRMLLECAISGGPMTSVVSQTGEFQRVTTWINQSYNELQTEHFNWDFLRSSQLEGGGVSFTTIAGQAVYPLGTGAGTVGVAAANFGSWVKQSFRDQTTTRGVLDQYMLEWISFDAWRDAYSFGAQQTVTTRPVAIAFSPENAICVGPWPTSAYTLTGDYFTAPLVLSTNTDVPSNIQVQWQMAIVYQAMIYYGMYESAPDVVARGERYYRKLTRQFTNLRTPMISAGRTLA